MCAFPSAVNCFAPDGCADWAELDPSEVTVLERKQYRRIYRRGETIFHQADEPQGIYCIETGYVLLWCMDAFGNETALGLRTPGESMGYRSLFAEEPHAATARALTDCRVRLIPRKIVEQLFDAHPALPRRFLRTLARDHGPPEALLLRGQHLPLRVRLANLLLILKEPCAVVHPDGRLVFELPLARHDLAAMVGVRPESVGRALKELEDKDLITFRRQRVTVPSIDRLLDVAGLDELP